MTCYKSGGCGVYENRSCNECPASKPEYVYRKYNHPSRSGKTYFEQSYLWYKLCVHYHAQTEKYDRTLTDLRSPHDSTEAYVVGPLKSLSSANARRMRKFIDELADRLGVPESIRATGLHGDYHGWSAQQWIDENDRLVDAGEMDFIIEFWEWNYGKSKKML